MPIENNPIIKRHLPRISIAVSLLFHALVFFLIQHHPVPAALAVKKQIPIEVRSISRAPSNPMPAKIAEPKKSELADSARKPDVKKQTGDIPHQGRSSSPSPASNPAKGLAYKDLLPSASSLGINAGAAEGAEGQSPSGSLEEGNGPYHGSAYQDIMIDSHSLQGIFDIPLFLRENADSATASFELEVLSETSLKVILLKGDPFLRAVIWERLKTPKATQSLYRIAQAMGEKILKVSLSYSSQYAYTTNANRFAEEIKIRKGQVKIMLTFNKDRDFGSQMGGIPLPDKDAKLAKRRDRLATSLLTESKAFQRVIRNETVTN